MHRHSAYVICFAALIAACQSAPRADGNGARHDSPDAASRPAPVGGLRNDAPAGTSAPAGEGSSEGPHEGQRGSTPPGTTRDGLPPSGGAIVDPAGAVTKTPPPPGMR